MDLDWTIQCEDFYGEMCIDEWANQWCEMMSDPYYWYDEPKEKEQEQQEEPEQGSDELPF